MANMEHVRGRTKTDGQRSVGYLKLPSGVELFQPDKEKKKARISILDYIVTDPKNIDKVKVGDAWYRRAFFVHSGIGIDHESVACRKAFGKKCLICEEHYKMKRDEDADEDATKALRGKARYLYVVFDHNHPDKGLQIWDISAHLFQNTFNDALKEAGESDPSVYAFSEHKGGKILRVKFKEKEFGGRSFLETVDVIFEDRDEDIPKELLKKIPNLDDLVVVLSEEEMLAKFTASEEDDEDEAPKKPAKKASDDDDDEEDEAPKKPSKKSAAADDEDDEEEEEDAPKKPAKKTSDDDDDDSPAHSKKTEDDEDEAVEDAKPSKKSHTKHDASDDDDDEDAAPKKRLLKKKPAVDEDDEEDEAPKKPAKKVADEDDEEEEAPKKPAKKASNDEDDEDEAPKAEKSLGVKCPHGFRFGKDYDLKKQCKNCTIWKKCNAACED